MPYQIAQADRLSFLRCRRQWDFGAASRRNLEPVQRSAAPDLGLAFREALDVYYFPGMWDWQPQVTRPLVYRGLERSLTRQRERCGPGGGDAAWERELDEGRWLLDRYFDWAPAVDRFSPVQVQPEFEVDVIDPGPPPQGVLTAAGELTRYRGTVDMLAVDAYDAYWIVRHRMVAGGWPPTHALVGDQEAATACWAWEQFYPGMSIVGTIYNEFRAVVPPRPDTKAALAGPRRVGGLRRWLTGARQEQPRRQVRQHEASGGGRSIPQHRRLYAAAREPARPDQVEQQAAANFRRTWVRRSPAEVAAAGRRLAADVARMIDPGTTAEPSPSDENCADCVFVSPCQAVFAGDGPDAALRSGYRQRPAQKAVEGRLGGGVWGLGRGAAPPRFRGGP